ncbi:MAG: hypothetical protein KGL95_02945 [Patescibacteria group bacterium]|nr:hypothetical protein [Patescibacteria group bacterium]
MAYAAASWWALLMPRGGPQDRLSPIWGKQSHASKPLLPPGRTSRSLATTIVTASPPVLYLPEIGPAFSMLNGCNTEPVVTVTGKSICNTGFVSLLKAEDGSSFCVKPITAQKLIERGWAKEIVTRNQTSSNQNSNSSLTLSNTMTGLRYDVGTINWNNQTYYFETPNYTETTSGQPAQILFHDVIFTLFPSSFGGIPFGECEGMHYFTYARFSDGTSEELHVFVGTPSCGYDYTPIKLSTHTNPQAGLTIYDGKMKLLASVENK